MLRAQGHGVVVFVRPREINSQVSGRPFVVCLLVSSEDAGSDVTRNIEMHLSRVASKSVGTRFIQAVQEPRDNDVDTVAGQRLDGATALLCFKDGNMYASKPCAELGNLGADGDMLENWLDKTGVLSTDAVNSSQVGNPDDSDDEEADEAPCGVKGCHMMFMHEHVGQGQSTGGVERHEGQSNQGPMMTHLVDDQIHMISSDDDEI